MNQGVFLCRTCDITFSSSDEYRSHAKSESHVNNLRSRVAAAGTTLLSSSTNKTTWDESRQPKGSAAQPENESDDGRSSSEDEDIEDEDDVATEFNPDQCLFCGSRQGTFDDNISHMATEHSFNIPQRKSLAVDTETLIWYLNLVIYGYLECILCAKRRHSVEAIQHHMMAKSHCRFDISGDMAEFYNLPSINHDIAEIAGSAESTVRLPSGKLLSHRNQPAERPFRAGRQDPTNNQDMLSQDGSDTKESSSTAMTRSDRTLARLATQLSQFRVQDQQSLAHLPAHELRAVLSSRMKQLSKARRDERRMMSRLEGKGNKTLMKHFKIDVPGRQNG